MREWMKKVGAGDAPYILVTPRDWITPSLEAGSKEVDMYLRGNQTAVDKLLKGNSR